MSNRDNFDRAQSPGCSISRHLVRGVDQADSWSTDGHKWLNTPFDCGYAFIADEAAHRAQRPTAPVI